MELKPIRRSEHIMALSKDHHFSLLFCWKIRQGLKMDIAAERMINYVRFFWQQHMQAHFREEEEILFAPLKDEMVQKAITDHRQITEQVEALLNVSATGIQKQLSLLTDEVERHVRFEERELFPYLEKILSAKQLEIIGKQLQKEPALKDDFEDEFWIRK